VRIGVDALDRELMRLIAVRFGYMRAAARIKPDRAHVRDETRKAQVIENVREDARQADLPAAELSTIWDALVEALIAYEDRHWQMLRDDPAGQTAG